MNINDNLKNEVPAVRFENIVKRFGSVVANDNINFEVRKGEVLSLLGENGSGKTTLMNMLSGIYYPDEGRIFINGEEAVISSPKDSFKYRIGMIHQHFKLVDVFSAIQNIALGVKSEGVFNLKKIRAEVQSICDKYGFEIDLGKKIYDMAVSEKQTVEIVKVLYRGADILILDEPTAVLTPQETGNLFGVLRKMRADGKAVVIITHKLNEVMEISDRVAILRKGKYIGTVETSETNEKLLTEMMVGEKTDLKINRPEVKTSKPLLEIRELQIKGDDGSKKIQDIDFYIRSGEILGVAGIAGCGQKELCEAIAGLRKIDSGAIIHKGESIVGLPSREIIKKGISMSFIPEDRLGMGLAPSFSITDNMMLKTYADKEDIPALDKTFKSVVKYALKKTSSALFVDRKTARVNADKLIKKLKIVTPSTETPVRRLSGGNVQKVLVGREIESGPNVIITAYPVRGLDINASYVIYDILNEQKEKGAGILFIGEDLDVMLALCDKIMVLCHGKNMGIVHADRVTKEQLGLMMTGALDLTEENQDKKYGIAKDSSLSEEEWEETERRTEESTLKKGIE